MTPLSLGPFAGLHSGELLPVGEVGRVVEGDRQVSRLPVWENPSVWKWVLGDL